MIEKNVINPRRDAKASGLVRPSVFGVDGAEDRGLVISMCTEGEKRGWQFYLFKKISADPRGKKESSARTT